jgi:uncharacterized membrane protein YkoI
MKQKTPTLLEVALQAQIASVQTAKTKLENAIQLAEDQHYAEIHSAEQIRRKAVVSAEKLYDAAAKIIEKAWQKVFGRALKSSFRDTRQATLEDREAIHNEAMLEQALPSIANEIPSNLPGLTELLASSKQALHDRRIQTGKNLSAAHDNSARADRKKIPQAKKKKSRDLATAKRRLDRAKAIADARLSKATAKADEKLNQAKLAAQLQFNETSAARKRVWAVYLEATQSAEQLLLSALK